MDKYAEESFSDVEKLAHTRFLINTLRRSSNYLLELTIKLYEADNYIICKELLDNLLKYCKNVTHIFIKEDMKKMITDEYLNTLFLGCTRLISITLKGLVLEGNCFKSLKANNVKELTIFWCEFKSEIFFSQFLPNLKNLNTLNLEDELHVIEKICYLLLKSNCGNIHEISITLCEYKSLSNNFAIFLSKQMKLSKLKLKNIKIDDNLISHVPKNFLEFLNLDFFKEADNKILLKHIHKFINLKIFKSQFMSLTNKYLVKLTKFINENINEISIHFLDNSSTSDIKCCFNRLKNLNILSFNFDCSDYSVEGPLLIDYILMDLLNCKKLKYLTLNNVSYSQEVFNEIKKMSNIKNVNVFNYFY